MADRVKPDTLKMSVRRKTSTTTSAASNSATMPDQQHGEDAILSAIKNALSNEDIIQTVVQSVLNTIISTPEVIDNIVSSVTAKLSDQITQSVYQSISMDIDTTKEATDANGANIQALTIKCNQLEENLDDLEQYSRRNCLLLHGVKETKSEDTTTEAINSINMHLGIDLQVKDIDRSHRLGKPKPPGTLGQRSKAGPIIIKFVSYQQRQQTYKQKRKMKGTSLLISESLTAKRMNIYRAAQHQVKEGKIKSTWTTDGKVTILTKEDRKQIINKISDLDKY